MVRSGFAVTAGFPSSLLVTVPSALQASRPLPLFMALACLQAGWAAAAVSALQAATSLSAALDPEGRVAVEYRLPDSAVDAQGTLYRSFLDIGRMGAFDLRSNPITRFPLGRIGRTGRWSDTLAADGRVYTYYLKVRDGRGREYPSQVAKVATRARSLPAGSCDRGCALLVDKARYILELRRGDQVLKRYPINLGADPVGRKLHQDNRTTPEGCYRIDLVKPRSQFHKAYGIDYPNREDRERYARAKRAGTLESYDDGSLPEIGGAVQIHGGGVGNNWTWGCMAMENDDIDELFEKAGLKAGTRVYIAGGEVTREEMLESLRSR